MKFDILTIFPDMIDAVMNESIIGRARKNSIIEINTVNIRDYSKDKHKKVDDYPYGGASGMVMMAQPLYDAYMSVAKKAKNKPKVIYLSPQGKLLNQVMINELREYSNLVLICGHYEGIDERIIEEIVDEEISIGDYVLTGGEIPAMVLIDCIARTIPGVLSSEASYSQESHYNGMLEYPQYTRPYEFRNRKVPQVLLSGHHLNIEKWRRQQSLKRTFFKRKDLFEKLEISKQDIEDIKKTMQDQENQLRP